MRSFMLVKRENHKILYFIRLVTNLSPKYSVSFKSVSGGIKASLFLKKLKNSFFSGNWGAKARLKQPKFSIDEELKLCYNN